MNRCPHCSRAIAACLCVGIALDTIHADPQAWCSLPPAAASVRTVGEAALPVVDIPEAATPLPAMRQLSPDQLSPAQALPGGFLQKAQVAAFVGVCAAVLTIICLPRLPPPADTVACGVVDEVAQPHIEISETATSDYVRIQNASPTTFQSELRVRWRERPC
jgi:hypothetical protein